MLKKISVWYALVLFLSFIVYPWWLLLDSFPKGLMLVNALLLLILGGYYVLKKIFKDTEVVISLPSRRQFLLMVLFFLLLLGIHAYALSFPIQPSDDEHFHASKGVYLAQSMRLVFSYTIENYLFLFIFSLLLLFLLGYLFMKNKDLIQDHWKKSKLFSKVVIILCGILLVNVYVICGRLLVQKVGLSVFGSSVSSSSLGWLIRFPPLGTMINGFVSLLGFEEVFLVRVIQLLFIFFAALYLYKLICLFFDEELAMISSILFLFVPGIFYFSNLAFMTGGELFFLAATSYYFAKYLQIYAAQRKHSIEDLGLLFLFLLLGVFYKEPVLFIVPVFIVGLVCEYCISCQWNFEKIKYVFKEFKLFWLLTLFVVVFAGIWIVLKSLFFTLTNSQQQSLILLKIFSFDAWIKYLSLFPELLTWPLLLLFLLGIVYFFTMDLKKIFADKDFFIVIFSLLWIVILLSIYVMYNWKDAVLRFMVTIVPPIIILTCIFVYTFITSLAFRRIIFGVFILFLALQSFLITYQHIEDHYWPYDELYKYMGNNVSSQDTVLFLVQHMDYYAMKKNMKSTLLTLQQIPQSALNNEEEFMNFLKEHTVTAVVFADSDNQVYTPSSFSKPDNYSEKFYQPYSLFFEKMIFSNKGFVVEEEFISGKNRLYFVRVSESE